MKTILIAMFVLCAALFTTSQAEATLVCEEQPSNESPLPWRCEESIAHAGQYIWHWNEFDGHLAPVLDSSNQPINIAVFFCYPLQPVEGLPGIIVQNVVHSPISVDMPLFGFLGGITHTTHVTCTSPSPPVMLAEDPVCVSKDDSAPASTRGSKGMSYTRSGRFAGRGEEGGGGLDIRYGYSGWGDGFTIHGMDRGNENGPVRRVRRCAAE